MANIFLVCPFRDEQSGHYIHNSLIGLGHKVAQFDWKEALQHKGAKFMNEEFIRGVEKLKPDITIIIKGIGLTGLTINKAKSIHPHNVVGWIFDVTLGGEYVKDVKNYIEFIKELDTFYTVDNDAIEELQKLDVNAKWLTEGCFEPFHKEQIINFKQEQRYGSDVVFLGSVGSIHSNREKFLSRLDKEGIPFKIWGDVLYEEGSEPEWVKKHHTGYAAINDKHSIIVQSSKIIIGLDGWTHRSKSWSARLYRTLCAGGFYLTTHTKDIEQYFTPGVHLDTFKDPDEMVEKILKYLSDDELREKISKAGKAIVLDKYQFKHRLEEMIHEDE